MSRRGAGVTNLHWGGPGPRDTPKPMVQPSDMYVRDLQVDTQMAKPWENFIDWRS
jgi:error-prone DNA polymerase